MKGGIVLEKEKVINELIELDRLFCEESNKHGAKAWTNHFSKDGIMISENHNPNIIGKEGIKNSMESLFNIDSFELLWQSLSGDVYDDFTLGYTIGEYTMKYKKNGKQVTSIGKYLTIWKKYDGEWKISLDMGN